MRPAHLRRRPGDQRNRHQDDLPRHNRLRRQEHHPDDRHRHSLRRRVHHPDDLRRQEHPWCAPLERQDDHLERWGDHLGRPHDQLVAGRAAGASCRDLVEEPRPHPDVAFLKTHRS